MADQNHQTITLGLIAFLATRLAHRSCLIIFRIMGVLLVSMMSFGLFAQPTDTLHLPSLIKIRTDTSYPKRDFTALHRQNPSYAVLAGLINPYFKKVSDSLTLPQLVVRIAQQLVGTPYVKGPLLGVDTRIKPIFCIRQLDCYTLLDNSIALGTALKRFQQTIDTAKRYSLPITGQWQTSVADHYYQVLEHIRYRDGRYTGFSSRLHYARDLIAHNEKQGRWINLTQLWPNDTLPAPLYRAISIQLSASDPAKQQMERVEDSLRSLPFTYIPSEYTELVLPDLQEGDIIGIVPKPKVGQQPAVEISHVGFVTKRNGIWYLLHASSQFGKVLIGPAPLVKYLKRPSIIGFTLIRLPDQVVTYPVQPSVNQD